ncbi:MAG: hypothetical protein LQ338_005419 [Usnochroma carphineum]|nr:MAG: hypothetical protein LQ338_005419 [Usnochroma carphineum]
MASLGVVATPGQLTEFSQDKMALEGGLRLPGSTSLDPSMRNGSKWKKLSRTADGEDAAMLRSIRRLWAGDSGVSVTSKSVEAEGSRGNLEYPMRGFQTTEEGFWLTLVNEGSEKYFICCPGGSEVDEKHLHNKGLRSEVQ